MTDGEYSPISWLADALVSRPVKFRYWLGIARSAIVSPDAISISNALEYWFEEHLPKNFEEVKEMQELMKVHNSSIVNKAAKVLGWAIRDTELGPPR